MGLERNQINRVTTHEIGSVEPPLVRRQGQQEDVGITVKGHTRYYTLLLKTKGKGAQGDKKGNTPSSSSIDPLGLLGPEIVQAKLILQELWKFRVKWDDNGIGIDRATFV